MFQINHHFRQNNSQLFYTEHPRWGATMGILISSDIKTGQEIFLHYGYDLIDPFPYPMPLDFPWYWDLKMKTEKSERLEAEKINKEKQEANDLKKKKLKNKQSAKQKQKTTKVT